MYVQRANVEKNSKIKKIKFYNCMVDHKYAYIFNIQNSVILYRDIYIYKIIRLLAFVYLSTPMIYSTCVMFSFS